MAKDREGSVNIYGAMQAKTAQGIVAYTDGIAHENEDGTVINLDEMLKNGVGGGSAIIDVEELPKGGWSGTAVPNSGIVENVYINNIKINCSEDEIKNIFNTIKSLPYQTELNNTAYPIFFREDLRQALLITKGQSDYTCALLEGSETIPLFYFIVENDEYKSLLMDDVSTTDYYTITIDGNLINEVTAMGISNIGSQNSKLSSLFSTTPFVKSEEPKDDVFYRVVKEKGVMIPYDGEVGTVYFNTKLSIEEVENILSNLQLIDFSVMGISGFGYFSLVGMNTGNSLMIYKNSSNKFYINLYNLQTQLTNRIFDHDEGWKMEKYEFNETNGVSLATSEIGMVLQNEKLLDIFSIEEFGTTELYSYKNGVFKKVLEDGDSGQSNEVKVFKTATSLDSITFTQQDYDDIKNNNNVLLIVNILVDGVNLYYCFRKEYVQNQPGLGDIILLKNISTNIINLNESSFSFILLIPDLTYNYKKINISTDFKINSFAIESNNTLRLSGTDSTGNTFSYSVNIDTKPTSNSKNLISSGAVYTALQSYVKTTEINQMIEDYITTNFENLDEGEY